MKNPLYAMTFLLAVLLQGCGGLVQPEKPLTLEQKCREGTAAGYSLNTEIRRLSATLTDLRRISAADLKNTIVANDGARAALDLGKTMCSSDLSTAQTQIEATTKMLQGLSDYLKKLQGAK